ncbi:MAG: R.Pab1 family restriction endonuclease [Treponema sp.]|nr:R.Pab1 family restriction endonuclease [Treponema sp.]
MDEIKIEKTKSGFRLAIPLKSQGKFRCKNRKKSTEYGIGFAPRTEALTTNSYVEWQIGYDAKVDDVKSGKKETSLTKQTFIGANGFEKYLYELSEIIWNLSKAKMIEKKQIKELISEINSFSFFLQENFQIQMNQKGTETINGMKSVRSEISLPTFTFDADEKDEFFTEISIQKQQYATGVQPMLYVIMPAQSFDNANDIIGKTSSQTPFGYYTISTKERAARFLKVILYFGLCSERHKHDVLEILKIIQNYAF